MAFEKLFSFRHIKHRLRWFNSYNKTQVRAMVSVFLSNFQSWSVKIYVSGPNKIKGAENFFSCFYFGSFLLQVQFFFNYNHLTFS